MSRSFFNAHTGVMAYQRSLQVTAENIANLNTNAYKKSEGSFTELLYYELRDKRMAVDPRPGGMEPIAGKGTHMYPVTRFYDQGELLLSDRPLDIAIEGKGFFRINRADGTEVYTRRGSFFLDDNGTIVTDQGDFLDVPFNLAGRFYHSLVIGPDGQVTAENEDGDNENLGRITLYNFVNEDGLFKAGNGLFEVTEASGEALAGLPGGEGFGILRQYYLEGSNVDLGMEMVHLITSQRALQANVRSLITADELKALTLLVRS